MAADKDTVFPYQVPVLDAQGKPATDAKDIPITTPDTRYWFKLKPLKTYGMQLAAQRAARVVVGKAPHQRIEVDDVLLTYKMWDQMILEGVVPDPTAPGMVMTLVPENYEKVSAFVGQQIDMAIADRDGDALATCTLEVAGQDADPKRHADLASQGDLPA